MGEIIKAGDPAPNLEEWVAGSYDLSEEYWTPEEPGERRRLVFDGIEIRSAPKHDNKEESIELPCVIFREPRDGLWYTVTNGSKLMISAFEGIAAGVPVEVTYLGRRQNKTNQNASDHWSVVILKKPGGA